MRIVFYGTGRDRGGCLISYQRTQRMIEWGCEVFLATVVASTEKSAPELAQIPMVSEFFDIFPDEVPGLPPTREVEFAIDLVSCTMHISRAPY